MFSAPCKLREVALVEIAVHPDNGESKKEDRVRGIFTKIDDKHVPLYRVLWIADVPHFCGSEECEVEGRYEVRLEADESIFGTRVERDELLEALESWHSGPEQDPESDWT